jgi:hypothetical protein
MSDTIDQQAADQRAAYISGLHKLADWLEQHPELPLPYDGASPTGGRLNFILSMFDDHKDLARRFARAFPGTVEKHIRDNVLNLKASFDGLHVLLIADRNAVCERVVVGTETVTEKVKDPELLAQVPEVEVTREREIVEWRCGSLLAPSDAEQDEAVSAS